MSGQSKLHSVSEAVLNTVIGYTVAMGSQYLIFPLFDIEVSFGEHLLIGLLFTLVSLIRSYCIRRLFNKLHYKRLKEDERN